MNTVVVPALLPVIITMAVKVVMVVLVDTNRTVGR